MRPASASRTVRRFAGGLVLVLAVLAAAGGLTACREPRPVRLVLVTLETLRLDALVADGGGRGVTMPRLRERAQRGALFERYYSASSVTQPAHATLMTGLHPWEHGVARNGQVLGAETETLAELLHGAGWATAAVVASFPVAGHFGFAQGFDVFDETFTHERGRRPWEGHEAPGRFYSLGGDVTVRAFGQLARMDAAGADRQFLWVHYFDPHGPYGDTGGGRRYSTGRVLRLLANRRIPAVRQLLPRIRAAYDRDVRFLDGQLDVLLSRLEEDAARYETHVVIVADHGESFGEGGAFGHGMRLTDEQIRVPLVILSPRVAPGLRREPVGSRDVAATLVALAGVDPSAPAWSAGRDLRAGPPADGGPAAVAGMRPDFGPGEVVEMRTDGSRHPLPRLAFFAADGAGTVVRGNASGLEAEERLPAEARRRYRRLFAGFERRLAASRTAAPSDEDRAKLRALGYVH